MKKTSILTIIALSLLFLTTSALAKKRGRKLPLGAYIKSAKIDILSGDLSRYSNAIAMLDSLALYYGPEAEALHLMGQMMVDFIDKTPDLKAKKAYVEKMVAYDDSLHQCCTNKKIKSKYKKHCKQYIVLADSVKVKYWRQFYNNGINQMKTIENLQKQIAEETDSAIIAGYKDDIRANKDSSDYNLQLAIIINKEDGRAYVGLATLYEKLNDFKTANEWLKKALGKTKDYTNILLSIAYNTIRMDNYCDAIPYLREYVDSNTTDTLTMANLVICYNNCKYYDSALAINQRILSINPQSTNALTSIGRFYNQLARIASDSSGYYQKQNDEKQSKLWRNKRDIAFDSSLAYFKKVVDLNPNDTMALEQYGTISALKGKFKDAAFAFNKLTALKPDEIDFWKFLGDSYLQLQEFDSTIKAYEKAVELDPNDLETWEHLKDLYAERRYKKKEAEAIKKIKSLK